MDSTAVAALIAVAFGVLALVVGWALGRPPK